MRIQIVGTSSDGLLIFEVTGLPILDMGSSSSLCQWITNFKIIVNFLKIGFFSASSDCVVSYFGLKFAQLLVSILNRLLFVNWF